MSCAFLITSPVVTASSAMVSCVFSFFLTGESAPPTAYLLILVA